jgi:hypothetical protein
MERSNGDGDQTGFSVVETGIDQTIAAVRPASLDFGWLRDPAGVPWLGIPAGSG